MKTKVAYEPSESRYHPWRVYTKKSFFSSWKNIDAFEDLEKAKECAIKLSSEFKDINYKNGKQIHCD